MSNIIDSTGYLDAGHDHLDPFVRLVQFGRANSEVLRTVLVGALPNPWLSSPAEQENDLILGLVDASGQSAVNVPKEQLMVPAVG